MMRVKTIAKASPNIIENASGPQKSEIIESGIIPITVVTVVRKIGRRRDVADSATMWIKSSLSLEALWKIIESSKMMEWLIITPERAITPSIEVKESESPVRVSPTSTPMSEYGTAKRRYSE